MKRWNGDGLDERKQNWAEESDGCDGRYLYKQNLVASKMCMLIRAKFFIIFVV